MEFRLCQALRHRPYRLPDAAADAQGQRHLVPRLHHRPALMPGRDLDHNASKELGKAMHLDSYSDGPRLLADIGGTNARFALEHRPGHIDNIQTLACADYPCIDAAITAYLAAQPAAAVRHAIIAIANPIHGDAVKM